MDRDYRQEPSLQRRTTSSRPAPRPAGSRPAPRPAGGRPASRPAGSRPASAPRAAGRPVPRSAGRPSPYGNRRPPQPPPRGGRPPQRRRRRRGPRFNPLLAIIAVILIVVLIIVLGGKKEKPSSTTAAPTAAPAVNQVDYSDLPAAPGEKQTGVGTLSDWIDSESDSELSGINLTSQIEVSDLSVNQGLPAEWMNILLLGTDGRTAGGQARSDAMIICSINTETGETKLTSILRDMAVNLDVPEEYQRGNPYRINSAFYFGGAKMAVKTVNELFGLNIQHYAVVNFRGFQVIAEAMGGIDLDITEAEMYEIDKNIKEQYMIDLRQGFDVDGADELENEWLMTYGPNTHLDGRQTLGYARIRHIDSDIERSNRQRKVLEALLAKAKNMSMSELIVLGTRMLSEEMLNYFRTDLSLEDIMTVANVVFKGGMSGIETLTVPVVGSYKSETRNEKAMLYDTDFATNAAQVYSFIYA